MVDEDTHSMGMHMHTSALETPPCPINVGGPKLVFPSEELLRLEFFLQIIFYRLCAQSGL